MTLKYIYEVFMKKATALVICFLLVFSIVSCDRATKSFDSANVRVISHRGLAGLEIENTEASFRAAGERSYYGIEADVRKTADGGFIMCHDETLEKLTGQDIPVESTPLSELKSYGLRYKGKCGVLVELSDYISICKEYGKHAFLELKSDFTKDEIARIIEIIDSLSYLDGVTFISFSYQNLTYVRDILPTQPVQFLASEINWEMVENLIRDGFDVSMSYKVVTPELVAAFHAAGLEVGAWTVDRRGKAEKLVALGVDYITTNILE